MSFLESNTPATDPQEGLPFDVHTLMVGVLQRRRFLIFSVAASVILGVVLAYLFGGPFYEAQSVLIYHPDSEGRANDPALTVQTQADMVLLESNLEEMRKRLNMEVSLKQLGAACTAKTQSNTALLMINVIWKSPEIAARMANTLRDVFVENQQKVRQSSAKLEVQDLHARIDQLRGRLKDLDAQYGVFSATNSLVDLDKETQSYLGSLQGAEAAYDEALAEKRSIDSRMASATRILRSQMGAKVESLGDRNTVASRLLNAIHEDQTYRSNQEKMELAKIEMDRAKQLYDEGLAPKRDFDRAELAYKAQREVTVDTDKVRAWRDAMGQLDQSLTPGSGPAAENSDAYQKLFQLQLDQVAAEEKVKARGEAVDRLHKKIATLPKLQRDYANFSRESDMTINELKLLEERLGRSERALMAKAGEFIWVADAAPPAFPVKSYRRLIFAGMVALGTFLAFGIVLAGDMLNSTVRSAGEANLKLPVPVVGLVPMLGQDRLAPGQGKRMPVRFRVLALHVKRVVPKTGARILFASARRGEGVSTVVANLAESLRLDHDHDVLVTDALGAAKTGEKPPSAVGCDYMLVDGPAILESIDSEVVAPSCDAVILVVASGITPVRDVREAISRIRDTGVPIAGAVLNRVGTAYL
jgi:uncharacterized protein involved in exopolysaccharide biosynthesis